MTHIIEVPFHIGDFLSGTMHMDGTEIGAFWLLCVAHYQAGIDGLPDDDRQLARIAKVSARVWSRIRPIIQEKFDVENGRWTQKRVIEVLQKIANKSAENSAKALKRWNQDNATALPQQCQPKTNNQYKKDISNEISKKDAARRSLDPPNDDFREWYGLYPHKVGKAAAERAYSTAARKASHGSLMAGLRRYIETKPPDRAWCNPATWLNQERWLDEPNEPTRERKNGKQSNDYSTEDALADVIGGIRQGRANQPHGASMLRLSGHLRQNAVAAENLDAGHDRGSGAVRTGTNPGGIHDMAQDGLEDTDASGYFETDRGGDRYGF